MLLGGSGGGSVVVFMYVDTLTALSFKALAASLESGTPVGYGPYTIDGDEKVVSCGVDTLGQAYDMMVRNLGEVVC